MKLIHKDNSSHNNPGTVGTIRSIHNKLAYSRITQVTIKLTKLDESNKRENRINEHLHHDLVHGSCSYCFCCCMKVVFLIDKYKHRCS